jgi:cytochrome bd-type quinol oxidase subunit 2
MNDRVSYDGRGEVLGAVGPMAVFRFIALVLIVLGLMLLGADVITMLERGSEPQLRSLENIWSLFSASGVESFKVWIAEISPAPVPDAILAFLSLPAFAVFGVVGVILAVIFRERDDFGEANAA